jgi:hypothetical protein
MLVVNVQKNVRNTTTNIVEIVLRNAEFVKRLATAC